MSRPKRIPTGVPWVLVGWLLLVLLSGCANNEPAGPSNSKPVIQRVTVVPDSVAPGSNVTLTAIALDDDEGDTLSYAWTTLNGTFFGETNESQVVWTAPGRIGIFDVILSVSDGTDTVQDTSSIPVYNSFSAQIILPANGAVFSPIDTIVFKGRLEGYADLDIASIDVEWNSDVDGLLDTSAPDTSGLVTFASQLSYDVHEISLTATLNDTLVATDTILVNNNQPKPVVLFAVERGYTFNRLTWTRFDDPTRFRSYHVTRRAQGETTDETIALIMAGEDTVFVDSLAAIGRTYTYKILAENSFGITAASEARSITTGVFQSFPDTYIGDMKFGADSDYIYLTLTDDDEVSVLDVTANNIDYTISVGDRPFGLAYNEFEDQLYVANSGDTTLHVIDIPTLAITDTINLPRSPLFLDINDVREQIFVTTVGNSFPLFIHPDPFQGGRVVENIEDSRLLVDSSLVIVDDFRDKLYLAEIGGYPASLYKYNTLVNPLQLELEDVHNTLGYNLRDLALLPDGSSIFLACTSPYFVQIVSSQDFSSTGSLNTGPYPNAVEISPDGHLAFTSVGVDVVQIWDLVANLPVGLLRFDKPVARGAIRISPDGQYVVVGTWNRTGNDSWVSIVYLPPPAP